MKTSTLALLITITLFLPLPANAEIKYELIDLGTLDRSWSEVQWTEPHCINDSGQIVGYAVFDYQLFAFYYDEGGMVDLGPDSGSGGAFSINNSGEAVGTYSGKAVIFDTSGAGNHFVLGNGSAESINDHGQIVGADQSWNHAIYFVDPLGDRYNVVLGPGAALSINNNGQIVGSSNHHATLFDPTGEGNNVDLGGLGGERSIAHAINDQGQIVGHSTLPETFDWQATLFDPTGGGNNIDMGQGMVYSINERGQIVGTAHFPHYGAALFDPTGSGNNIPLNNLIDPKSGWDLVAAYHINDNGWIVGEGITPDGENHGYLLIPEPATLVLLGLGLLGIRKRRK